MKKRDKILYWAATIWLASAMLAGGIQQLFVPANFLEMFEHLGYPLYFMRILGVWKILATAALLAPGFGLLKEWTYAGSFFLWSGALVSHLALGDPLADMIPAVVLLVLTVVSWIFRPAGRRIAVASSSGSAVDEEPSHG